MKALNTQTVMQLAKCSKSTAIEIVYNDLLESKKLYLNRKNNSTSTIKWLEKNFDAKFTNGNDAPRGGKFGDFVTFTTNNNFETLVSLINQEESSFVEASEKRSAEQNAAVQGMVISEAEKQNFLEKTKDMSNKKARTVAHNFAARKLGFYSNEAKDKFMNLRNK